MKALIKQEGEVFVIHLKGHVDMDSTEPFRKTVLSHLKKEKVIFNLNELSFVGSNGITPFIETLVELTNLGQGRVHFCHLSSEFQRIFEASDIQDLRIFENETTAKSSFYSVFQESHGLPRLSQSIEEVEDSEDLAFVEDVSTPD
jgi:anti-anti-sigma factor